MNCGSSPGFPVAQCGELAQSPGHESGQVHKKTGSNAGKAERQVAARRDRGDAAELSALMFGALGLVLGTATGSLVGARDVLELR